MADNTCQQGGISARRTVIFAARRTVREAPNELFPYERICIECSRIIEKQGSRGFGMEWLLMSSITPWRSALPDNQPDDPPKDLQPQYYHILEEPPLFSICSEELRHADSGAKHDNGL